MKLKFSLLIIVLCGSMVSVAQTREDVYVATLDSVLSRYYKELNKYCSSDGPEKAAAEKLVLYYLTADHQKMNTELFVDVANQSGSWKKVESDLNTTAYSESVQVQTDYLRKVTENKVVSFDYQLYLGKHSKISCNGGEYKVAAMNVWVTIKKNDGSVVQGAEMVTFVCDDPSYGVWKIIKTELSNRGHPTTFLEKVIKEASKVIEGRAVDGFYYGVDIDLFAFPYLINRNKAGDFGLGLHYNYLFDSEPMLSLGVMVRAHSTPACEFFSSSDKVSNYMYYNNYEMSFDVMGQVGCVFNVFHLKCGLGPMISFSLPDKKLSLAVQPELGVFIDENLEIYANCLIVPNFYHPFQGVSIGISYSYD